MAASLHAQLASILEVLANTAVAEICELVDSGYAVLQLELSRSRKENQALRGKLRLLELRAAQTAAIRAAARRRPRVLEARKSARTTGAAALSSNQQACLSIEALPPPRPGQEAAAAPIKAEDKEEEFWSRSDPHDGFSGGSGEQTQADASSIKQEAAGSGEDGGGGGVSQTNEEVSSTSSQGAPSTNQSTETSGAVPSAVARRQQPQGRVCKSCGKTLACLKSLKIHMRVHTGEKPYVCALCGKRFSDPSNLKRHQSVHTGEKRYGCVRCGRRFAQSGSLKAHQSVHASCGKVR